MKKLRLVLLSLLTIVTQNLLIPNQPLFSSTSNPNESLASEVTTSGEKATQGVVKASTPSTGGSWDIFDLFLPDVIKNLPPSTLLMVGVLFAQGLGWSMTKSNVAKYEQQNAEWCYQHPAECQVAGGFVDAWGTSYPAAPILGTHPSQSDVDIYYESIIISELLIVIFMPEIMKGINGIGHWFSPKDLVTIDAKSVERWRITYGAVMLGWEAGTCLWSVSVKKEF
jgi:hypothetical protein